MVTGRTRDAKTTFFVAIVTLLTIATGCSSDTGDGKEGVNATAPVQSVSESKTIPPEVRSKIAESEKLRQQTGDGLKK